MILPYISPRTNLQANIIVQRSHVQAGNRARWCWGRGRWWGRGSGGGGSRHAALPDKRRAPFPSTVKPPPLPAPQRRCAPPRLRWHAALLARPPAQVRTTLVHRGCSTVPCIANRASPAHRPLPVYPECLHKAHANPPPAMKPKGKKRQAAIGGMGEAAIPRQRAWNARKSVKLLCGGKGHAHKRARRRADRANDKQAAGWAAHAGSVATNSSSAACFQHSQAASDSLGGHAQP